MIDDPRSHIERAMFTAQMVFGAIALSGLMLAAISWRDPSALTWAVVACGFLVISQVLAMRGLVLAALGLWLASFAVTALSALSLLNPV